MLRDFIDTVVGFAKAHPEYLIPIVFAVAFAECLAFISILAPATVLFAAFGAIAGAGGIGLFPVIVASTIGSALGYWVSYGLGLWIGPSVMHMWPLNRKPELYKKVHDFFERWGALGILISHFWGQVRPLAPLVAGIVKMPALPFHIANLAGSLGWSFGVFYASGQLGTWARLWTS
jgi:membrane protein DedA with SNARE-associated domain